MISRTRLLLVLMALMWTSAPAFSQGSKALEFDEASRAKINALPEPQREFILSGKILDFIPRRQLEVELTTRDAAELESLLGDLTSLADQMAYDPERDMGAAPLNLASKRFNSPSKPTHPALREQEREPGPFSVHRYLYPKSGIPTFGDGRVAIWPEDLEAGEVDVAIIGMPSNMGSGRRDAAFAPYVLRVQNTTEVVDEQSLVRPLEVLNVVDYGNFRVDNLATERSIEALVSRVAETAATGAVPMLIGGDTSMLYPSVKGVAQSLGHPDFGLLHLSAHPDTDRHNDHTISDTQALFLLIEEGIVDGRHAIPVGLRGSALNVDTLQWLRAEEVRYHTMVEIQERGFDRVLKRIKREVSRSPEAFFVSIDVSVIDPTQMVAAGRLAANGLLMDQVSGLLRDVCASKDIIGFALTDLAPMLDLSRLSATHANTLLNTCLAGMAVRKVGLKADYVNPLVLDHEN